MNGSHSASTEPARIDCDAEMSPDVTQCHLGADRLNDRQLLAMSMMLAGKPDGEIVKAVGVHRRTLWRWRRYDDDFRSELLRRREALCEEAGDRLRALLAPALDVMEQHLFDRYDRNRFRAASAVLHVSNLRQSVPLRSQGLDTA